MYNLPPKIADRLDSGLFANLHTFLVVARYKSFSRGADELCLTTSAVSHRIKRLESALGMSLFVRLTRKIALTADGERLFGILQRTMSELAQALEPTSEERVEGRLTVYARPSVAACWLVPQLATFSADYPGLSIDLRVGNDPIDFRSQNIDLAIDYTHGPFPGLVSHKLMDESTAPVCSPKYADQHELIGCPSNIVRCTLLHDSLAWNHASHDAEWALWCSQNVPDAVLPDRTHTFDRSDLCIVAAVNHLGIAMGRRHLVESHICSGELVLPFGAFSQSSPYSYYAVHREGVLPRRAAVFVSWLRDISQRKE
ncbi:DNA-binding transcriptional regulator DsdC [Paraburkholderia phenoliruptrix]|uniref:HTH-type transcriptional regulator dsdC n=2 Tax=Paraburkholderia phenoliruptrix TaxID=252970 RepID=K0E1L0_9BURK|nr:DNA-binding transcriptional regulator DsdC [Paraburkholderia phenoliruptrix]AFT90303.1 HTH-type transcriptional regulator dsdC [Paraburkholderia phenoliruptrix BR3459a]CAB4051722.1 HTH-type transcriptional regulator DsdC [Paraburkholderia phenoliruptrix]